MPLLARDPRETLEAAGMLFVKDAANHRVDLLLCDVEFDRQAVLRGRELEVRPGLTARICTAEDLIVYKLISTRPRDHEDAQNVIRRQAAKLDQEYVLGWLRQFEEALDDSTLVQTFTGMLRRAL